MKKLTSAAAAAAVLGLWGACQPEGADRPIDDGPGNEPVLPAPEASALDPALAAPALEDDTVIEVRRNINPFFDGGERDSILDRSRTPEEWLRSEGPLGDLRPAGPASSNLAVTPDGRTVVVAAQDHDLVLLIDASSLEVTGQVAVAGAPYHVVVGGEGRAYVTSRFAGSVSEVDLAERSVTRTFLVGTEPMGLDLLDESTLLVAVAGEARVARVSLDDGTVTPIDLPHPEPWSVAVVGDEVVVGFVRAPDLYRLKLNGIGSDMAHVPFADPLAPDVAVDTPALTQVRALTPIGSDRVLASHSRSDSLRMRSLAGGSGGGDGDGDGDGIFLPPSDACSGGGSGYGGGSRCSAGPAAVDPGFTVLPMDAEDPSFGVSTRFLPSAPFQIPVATAVVLRRSPEARAEATDDALVLTLPLGRPQVVVTNLRLDHARINDPLLVLPLPEIADGLTAGPDGRFFVFSRFSRILTRITPTEAAEPSSSARRLAFGLTHSAPLLDDALSEEASDGRVLFHRADVEGMNPGHRVACASCHPDGRSDGLTWQFVFGPRNTPSLAGGILDTAPFHWPGDVFDIRHLNQMTIQALMGGDGVSGIEMDKIGAYIDTLPAPPAASSLRALDDVEELGRSVFEDPATGCLECHAGEDGTDNLNHALVLGGFDDENATFQTPHLHGLARTAPYLHTGEVASLEHLVEWWVRTDLMGHGSHLSREELDALVAYLKTR